MTVGGRSDAVVLNRADIRRTRGEAFLPRVDVALGVSDELLNRPQREIGVVHGLSDARLGRALAVAGLPIAEELVMSFWGWRQPASGRDTVATGRRSQPAGDLSDAVLAGSSLPGADRAGFVTPPQ
jgi:hypothetical protein